MNSFHAATVSILLLVGSASASSWNAFVNAACAMYTTDIVTRLDQAGGKVFEGQIDGACWIVMWDVAEDELQVWKAGSRVSNLSQSISNNTVSFSATALDGTISVNSNDDLLIDFQESSGPIYHLAIDTSGDVVSSAVCRCQTQTHGPAQGTCTQAQCDATDACGDQGQHYCSTIGLAVSTCQ